MWQTIGHSWAVEHLERSLITNRIARANLFTGPANIGKTHLALEVAAALNCRGTEPPCGICRDCLQTSAGTYADLLLVEPDDGRIKIDQIRDLQYELALSPHEGRWRVCILTDFHTTTTEAANALLKTLEEPPSRVVLLLTALDPGLLLPTIVSRCRLLPLRPVPAQTIADALVTRYRADPDTAQKVARLAAGRVGWAIRALEDSSLLEQQEQDVEMLLMLISKGQAAKIQAAEAVAKRDDVRPVLHAWQTVWRDIMLIAAGRDDLVVKLGHNMELRKVAHQVSLDQARRAISRAQDALAQIEQNVNARLALETMLLSWNYL